METVGYIREMAYTVAIAGGGLNWPMIKDVIHVSEGLTFIRDAYLMHIARYWRHNKKMEDTGVNGVFLHDAFLIRRRLPGMIPPLS